jgi:hypothetical protein
LFPGLGTGNFAPSGALLTNLKPPVVSFATGALGSQSGNAVVGWIQPSIPA